MCECKLEYIPKRLHKNGRIAIGEFQNGERLYFRCNPNEIDNPYLKISLADLSHNRSGFPVGNLSERDDVLWNIVQSKNFERHTDKGICTLEIEKMEYNKYHKSFTQDKNGTVNTAYFELIHDPEECMYPHCIFKLTLNGEHIKIETYKESLKRLSEIKDQIKHDLAAMILTEKLKFNA